MSLFGTLGFNDSLAPAADCDARWRSSIVGHMRITPPRDGVRYNITSRRYPSSHGSGAICRREGR